MSLYLIEYPQVSESYIRNEIEVLQEFCDVQIVSMHEGETPDPTSPGPVVRGGDEDEVAARIGEFDPDIIHGHWLLTAPTIGRLAERLDKPFTIRAHSFDTAPHNWRWYRELRRRLVGEGSWRAFIPPLHDGRCAGVLAYPYSVDDLVAFGAPPERLVPCMPVMAFDRFHDRSPNGDGVVNCGAAQPKKAMTEYLELAAKVPDQRFTLYPIGHQTDLLRRRNDELGTPVDIRTPVPHDEMPAVYKQHRWLVYTSDRRRKTVGWSVAAAEAQAAGLGVCVQRVRPDIDDYIGDAGIVFDDVDELVDVVRGPVPEDMRERGFEAAKRCDVRGHLHLLTDLWASAGVPVPST